MTARDLTYSMKQGEPEKTMFLDNIINKVSLSLPYAGTIRIR